LAQGKLFEYAVLYHPKRTKDEVERNVWPKSELLGKVELVVAQSENEVAMLAARSIDSQYVDKLEDIDVVIRPFE
jgi:hypothetical protein